MATHIFIEGHTAAHCAILAQLQTSLPLKQVQCGKSANETVACFTKNVRTR